ncbi:hypothetical protein ACHAXA_001374 [Cyclostephanos tholiformis]|uniref:Protein kinase domain-containing protein n=1 Tax=Cyclostephanos tholiformis TaxID=382380 RepID=A0ABD3RDY2_9STRA
MGQEASVDRNGYSDEAKANHPGAGETTMIFGDKFGVDSNAAAAAAAAERPKGGITHQQPQSQKQPPQLPHHAVGTSSSPQQYQQQREMPPSSYSSSTSMMSRAGLSSAFQRAVNGGGIGMGSVHGPRKSGKSSGQPLHQQQHQQKRQEQQQQQQQQEHRQRQQQDRQIEPISKNTNNHGSLSPVRSFSAHHKDLSPESMVRQLAVKMKNQAQEQQQRQTKPTLIQQSSPLAAVNSSNSAMPNSNRFGVDDDVGVASSSIVQDMTNLHLSPQRPLLSQQSQPQTPPSPRALLLKKMQNNDEEDWEKAWAEDSEDSDDDGDATPKRGINIIAVPAMAGVLPTVPYLEQDSSRTMEAIGSEVDGSMQLVATPARISPVQSTFTPANAPPREQPRDHAHEQQQRLHSYDVSSFSGMSKMPIIQYPPIRPDSHYLSPENPLSQREVEDDERLMREANEALQYEEVGEDGQRYDLNSYIRDGILLDEKEGTEDERPCVSMFDPALRVLGRGSFGRVVLVQKQRGRGSGTLYAMKILRKSHLVRRRQIERTKTERKVLALLDHPFIMKMYYAFQTPDKLYLVLDYCPGGELFFHLSRYRRFQEPVARFYAAELLLAIGHLHKNGIIYRDLKPENVLLDAYGHVKLGDFGLAKDGIRHPTQGAKSTCGTPEYMAPEVLNQSGHGFCVDYWGLGMILYEMMTGLPPWYTTDRSKLFRRLRSAPLIFPKEVQFSQHCKACIAGLLEREPRMRLGVMGLRSAIQHEFFYRRINFEALRARQISAPIRPCEAWTQFNKNNSFAIDHDSEYQQHSFSGGGGVDGGDVTGSITTEAIDVATANFDESFRRMPIETEDYERQQQAAGHPPISESELNEQTFRGFTYDGEDDDLPQNNDQTHYHHTSGKPSPPSAPKNNARGGFVIRQYMEL